MLLEDFNAAGRAEAAAALRPCLDIERWIAEIVDSRPFGNRGSLREAAVRAADPFTGEEVEAALAHHPRIGERAAGNSTEARLSQSEQATLGASDPAVAAAIAEGNRAYEEKFGQVFLIRAAGRSREEILAALNARLAHTSEEEQPIIGQQLREIAVLRLEGLIGP
ncbi:2-oxo-4-hydroxy-4-carboxy-5-ureidoimidazoline decarboxylase [Arthrobacter sp. ov118]|uniref:2-oxo-4-hydroxy-4-carboxy-5-ureidoimidazoline decarboxylase n=1 Tax=Arthrobacter sp. ov118 TaxID=1761747 RepID=UPI0008EA2DD4|nr:2-oxo-4-hydroxy-4-carboxy-5-ureidoimidazoline decarboxylase [Arthrobacter sp. ov118]SFT55541.1 2-oxo-4-hydroxy-4-carboxy-5-ureidoimidazoline decarboxylase [Arthrobacter sp. ov118]